MESLISFCIDHSMNLYSLCFGFFFFPVLNAFAFKWHLIWFFLFVVLFVNSFQYSAVWKKKHTCTHIRKAHTNERTQLTETKIYIKKENREDKRI